VKVAKMARGTKDVNWGAPKHIQMEYIGEIDPPEEVKGNKRSLSKKNKKCKFYKGEHQFEVVKEREYFNGRIVRDLECKCGKKDYFFS
jgi:hypothetical protein